MVRPKGDLRNDLRCGFEIVKARDIDRVGILGIIGQLKKRVAGTKVYISVDIDVLDPAFAPGKCSFYPQLYRFSSRAYCLELEHAYR
jgi:arginase family enzyme